MLNIAIIEDNEKEAQEVLSVLEEWAKQAFETINAEIYPTGEEYFKDPHPVIEDLFILDIKLEEMSGLEVAQRLRSEHRKCQILFLTAYADYALDGYQYHAINFIVKPVTLEKISKTLYEILDARLSHSYAFSEKSGALIQIPFDNILYVISEKHAVHIHTRSMVYTENVSISEIIGRLPKTFVRIHRSYIVNMVNIERLSRTAITLIDYAGDPIPVGRSHAPEVQRRFAEYSTRFEHR